MYEDSVSCNALSNLKWEIISTRFSLSFSFALNSIFFSSNHRDPENTLQKCKPTVEHQRSIALVGLTSVKKRDKLKTEEKCVLFLFLERVFARFFSSFFIMTREMVALGARGVGETAGAREFRSVKNGLMKRNAALAHKQCSDEGVYRLLSMTLQMIRSRESSSPAPAGDRCCQF